MKWTEQDHAFVRIVLHRYRRYLVEYCGLSEAAAHKLAADRYAGTHRHYLIIFKSFSQSEVGLVLEDDVLLDLSVAAYCVMRMAVAIDKAVDDLRGKALPFAFDNQQMMLLLLAKHLPHSPLLWSRHNKVMSQYWRVAELERREFVLNDASAIALLDEVRLFKSCPLHMVLDWIDALAPGRVDPELWETLNLTSKVWQIIDDIKDFKEDLAGGQTTMLIFEVDRWLSSNDLVLRDQESEMQMRLLLLSPVVDQHLLDGRKLTLEAIASS